jgi:hypothetical protein
LALRLRPLRDDELPAYIEHSRAAYERELVEQAGLTPEQAATKTETDGHASSRTAGSPPAASSSSSRTSPGS